MGFDAIMISPIIENVHGRVSYGEAYHGYWPLDLYNVNAHFGTPDDLRDLSNALHARGMYLLMDTVINNMAYITNGSNPATSIDYSVLTPFDRSDYYHPYCKITDWTNYTNAELCQTGDNIVALPDLYTEHSEVQEILENWANDMISNYSIDGLRIDAAKHVSPGFLKNFGDSVDTFMTGEVLEESFDIICKYQRDYIGSLPNYPIYYAMLNAFTLGNISSLALEVEMVKNACPDVTALVSFSENHDVARIASMVPDIAVCLTVPEGGRKKEKKRRKKKREEKKSFRLQVLILGIMQLAKNVITFTLLFDGVPMIYQGQEQHFDGGTTPQNREALWTSGYNTDSELYKMIAKINRIRSHIIGLNSDYLDAQSHVIYQGSSDIAFTKGVDGRQMIMLLSSQGSKGKPYTVSLPVGYNAGTTVTETLSCKTYTVNNLAEFVVEMDAGEPRVFFPTQFMNGSGLCGYPLSNISYSELRTGHLSMGASWGIGTGKDSRARVTAPLGLMVVVMMYMLF
ncbi:alpha-amylase [Penicillium chermesinum]|uniref:alpha-amylase n=1 Tax=Penicillium chermesinum TaxID=63820 RepID=A0A9W9PJ11_9EURO|nr:alpha-amylase [Penicillium chermesinum]KAJ5247744.1 alpha-amylase [Penicillium chermesinum]